MKKKMVLVLLMATMLTGGVFAQMSAGIGGSFGAYMVSYSHPDFDIDNPKPVVGGGFHGFFDANYALVKLGLFIGGNSEEDSGITVKSTATYFSLGLLGKFPIDLGGFTLFPMLGFEYNMFMSGKMSAGDFSFDWKRADLDKAGDSDMFLLQLGVGADINLGESIYLRPSLLWGIDLTSSEAEQDFKDADGKVFKHKLDIGIAVGFRF
jgi:hypothetical protein